MMSSLDLKRFLNCSDFGLKSQQIANKKWVSAKINIKIVKKWDIVSIFTIQNH